MTGEGKSITMNGAYNSRPVPPRGRLNRKRNEWTHKVGAAVGLMQTVPNSHPPGFWDKHGDAVFVALLTAFLFPLLKDLTLLSLKKFTILLDKAFIRYGWVFRKRYLAVLAEQHRWLKLIGVYSTADLYPPRLQEVYISLRLAAARGDDGPRFNWNEVLHPEERYLVILGSPGSGKSTLLDYLVLVLTGYVEHPLRNLLERPFPLFARLRDLEHLQAGTLLSLLAKSSPLRHVPPGYPEAWLKQGRCFVMLDGLDEILDETKHAGIAREIQNLVSDYPNNWYIVTCRTAGWHNQLSGFRSFEVQPLSGDDIRRFITLWYKEVLRIQAVNRLGIRPSASKTQEAEATSYASAVVRSSALWQAIVDNDNILRIASTPLLLSLVTLVHFHRVASLPKGREDLYSKCLEILLEVWDLHDKNLEMPKVPTLKEKRIVLEAIAFRYLKGDLLEANLQLLAETVAPLLPKLHNVAGSGLTAETLMLQIVERSGILQEQRVGYYGFAHRALHDYLAASYIVSHVQDRLLLERVGEERWREVILIAAVLAPESRSEALVKALLLRDSESGAELEMAGLTLAEDIQLGEDLRAEAKHKLLSRLTQEEAAGPFRRLAKAFLAADVTSAQEWMHKELGEDSSPQRKRRVLELIPTLGESHCRALTPTLIKIIADETVDIPVRAQAARSFSEAKMPTSQEAWDALRMARKSRSLILKNAAAWCWCELGRYEELGLVQVPAGEFLMGSDSGDTSEAPLHAVDLPTFYIAKQPVRVGDFRVFLAESGYSYSLPIHGRGIDSILLNVSWYDALAFSQWQGFCLPSEAEWEKAARGTDGRIFPWGNMEFALSYMERLYSPYGCEDMTGNIGEWTRSLWGPQALRAGFFKYPYNSTDGREQLNDLRGFSRVVRSGSRRFPARNRAVANQAYSTISFRVAVSSSCVTVDERLPRPESEEKKIEPLRGGPLYRRAPTAR